MCKKITERLYLVVIMIMQQACFTLYSQDTLNADQTEGAEWKMQRTDLYDMPSFVNDSLYNAVLNEAINLQQTADSIESLAFQYRQQIMFTADTYEKNKLQHKVIILEENMAAIQDRADSLFKMLDSLFKPAVIIPRTSLLVLDTVINGIKVYHYNLEEMNRAGQARSDGVMADKKQQTDIPEIKKIAEEFEIFPQTPYSPQNPFEDDFVIPQGVFYRIQLAALSQQTGFGHFGGIYPITTEATDDGKITRYFAGKFSTHANAAAALGKVRSAGFKDAFIVSYYNGQRMSVEKVQEFEKSYR